jgi:tripartite ATP-independent transporter DctM subunit
MEPTTLAIVVVVVALTLIIIGFPVAFSLGGVAVIATALYYGSQSVSMYVFRIFDLLQNYILIAIPLFIFMGYMLQNSGVAERMYKALRLIMGPLRGGLALATVATGTLFAAATGVVGASVVTLGAVALPTMLAYHYDKRLISGTVCASGTLGIIIPPSILIILYGPMAGLSVGRLFASTLVPALILSFMYLVFIFIYCLLNPHAGPALSVKERTVPIRARVVDFAVSAVPTLLLITAVLGSIIFGIAAPTEAAAIGAVATLVLAAAYRRLNFTTLFDSLLGTLRLSSMIFVVTISASIFTGLFIRLGGGQIIEAFFLGLGADPLVVVLAMVCLIVILGMFLDWIGVLLICVPLFTPIVAHLQVDPIWFATVMIIGLQLSYLTPPFALAIFYLRGIAPPEITTGEMYLGIVPFLLIQLVVLAALFFWPALATWLPGMLHG